MDRASQKSQVTPSSTEVSREEKGQITSSSPAAPSVRAAQAISAETAIVDEKKISLNQLINKLNHLNFREQTLSVIFDHVKYPRKITLEAHPRPCHDRMLVCRWVERVNVEELIETYRFKYLHISKDQQLVEVVPKIRNIGEQEVVFSLPDTCCEINERKIRRYQCRDIAVFLFQNGALFHGRLADYYAFQFRVEVTANPPQTFRWIDTGKPVTLVFSKGCQTLYSGECNIVRYGSGQNERFIILEPVHRQIRRFRPHEFRSTRQKLTPSPDVAFVHPLCGKSFRYKIVDISGSGFSVKEEEHLAVLLPGLIIPRLEMQLSNGSIISCMAQVVYSKADEQSATGTRRRCGLAILDMNPKDHIVLLSLLQQASDANSYLCNSVDMDALWAFFFETGFIYPQKYEFLQLNKARIKKTYETLYNKNPSIAAHFIHQENGRILAHMAMVRVYETSWLIHHHAAIRSSYNRGGLMVLNQVGRFINDSYRIYSMKMDYIFCYFRPQNKFPNHVFGGTARHIKDQQICSLDDFAYLHPVLDEHPPAFSANWSITPSEEADLLDLQTFYGNMSGGLMLKGLQLDPNQVDLSKLSDEYERIGLTRDRKLFTLRHRNKICALLAVDITDLGLNMSDLTNSIKFFVLDPTYLNREIFQATIGTVVRQSRIQHVPVMVYPKEVADRLGYANSPKTYCMWTYDLYSDSDHYFKFLKRLLKFIHI
jgi:hypothetical protein